MFLRLAIHNPIFHTKKQKILDKIFLLIKERDSINNNNYSQTKVKALNNSILQLFDRLDKLENKYNK